MTLVVETASLAEVKHKLLSNIELLAAVEASYGALYVSTSRTLHDSSLYSIETTKKEFNDERFSSSHELSAALNRFWPCQCPYPPNKLSSTRNIPS